MVIFLNTKLDKLYTNSDNILFYIKPVVGVIKAQYCIGGRKEVPRVGKISPVHRKTLIYYDSTESTRKGEIVRIFSPTPALTDDSSVVFTFAFKSETQLPALAPSHRFPPEPSRRYYIFLLERAEQCIYLTECRNRFTKLPSDTT